MKLSFLTGVWVQCTAYAVFPVGEWISLSHFSMTRWEDAAWHSLLYEELIRKNHAYSSNHKQLPLQVYSGEEPRKHSWKDISNLLHILPQCERDSETKYRKRTAQLTAGRSLQGVNTMLSSTRSLSETYTYVYGVCICTRIMGQRHALKVNLSNLHCELCFIFQSHLGTHEQQFFCARWPGKSAPPTCTIEAHILGILDSQHQLLNFTISLLLPCRRIFQSLGESYWAQKMVYIYCTQQSFFSTGRPAYFLEGSSYFLILQYRSTWKKKNAKQQSLYRLNFLNSKFHKHVSVE